MAQLATADTVLSSPARATILGGRYSLDEQIGEGGMALVYRGRHIELDQTVAIKLVLPELAFDAEATARFLNEARTIAKLRGPHVARVLDSGCSEPGRPFMVLEYLEGSDLRKLLDVNSVMAVDTAVGFVLEAAEALAEAHAIGIVHRDIKPENLFLARMPDGTVCLKVLDFGICKHQTPERSRSFTLRGKTLGSPHYMAPEQITSPETVDARADIWALGVVLYELLSGYQPFTGDTLTSLCAHVVHSEPRKALRRVNPEVPSALDQVVRRCLSKNPDDRYKNVVELAGALAPFCGRGAELVERIRRMAGHETAVPRSITPLALNVDSRYFRPRRRWVSVVAAFATAAGLAFTVSHNGQALASLQALLASSGLTPASAAAPAAPPTPGRETETQSRPAAAAADVALPAVPVKPAEPAPELASASQKDAAPPTHVTLAATPPTRTWSDPRPTPAVKVTRAAAAPRASAPRRAAPPSRAPRPRAVTAPPAEPAALGLLEPAAVERDDSELIAPYDGGS